MSNAISKWFGTTTDAESVAQSNVARKHSALTAINQTVTEYGALLEQVSADRAHLLKTISELQLQNAELSVGKALYADLEAELGTFREAASQALALAQEKRALTNLLEHERIANADLRQEVSSLKGQLTRLKNKASKEATE